jgi:hypothetical protein
MAETKLPDIVETLYGLFLAQWTAGNTNDRTPNFTKRTRIDTMDHGSHDAVGFYDKASNEEDVGIMHAHTEYEHFASIEVRTSYGDPARRHANRMKSESQRIVNTNGSYPTSYIEYKSSTDNEVADFKYDILEVTGSNVAWDGPNDCRLVIEVKAVKYYKTQHT